MAQLLKSFTELFSLSVVPEKAWGYQDEVAPKHWDCLSDNYALCGQGKSQSPIDIVDAVTTDLPILEFNYQPTQLITQENKHTLHIDAEKAGYLKVGSNNYQLVQFHFHTPSEEAIAGKTADMVIHLVHQNIQGQLAVVALLLKVATEDNPFINTLWQALKQAESDNVEIDLNQLLPEDKNYYSFDGSLTTPPCTEGVKWLVMKQAISLSANQLAQYCAIYPSNVRPLQPLNGRQILSSN
ncbi:MAG: carbonic anhydrase family protein [Thiomargarita sp.]|nr:carbonic anhydrase family protein [Thiomargarita sp.]